MEEVRGGQVRSYMNLFSCVYELVCSHAFVFFISANGIHLDIPETTD